jgi:hypothetical protein
MTPSADAQARLVTRQCRVAVAVAFERDAAAWRLCWGPQAIACAIKGVAIDTDRFATLAGQLASALNPSRCRTSIDTSVGANRRLAGLLADYAAASAEGDLPAYHRDLRELSATSQADADLGESAHELLALCRPTRQA